MLREGHASGADWILFDADLEPMLDPPIFAHSLGLSRPGRRGAAANPRRIVFSYLVPVHVVVEDGQVSVVVVLDGTPMRDPAVVSGDPSYRAQAVAAADDG